jgi:hypothetical protein
VHQDRYWKNAFSEEKLARMLLAAATAMAGVAVGAAIAWRLRMRSRQLATKVSGRQPPMAKLEDEHPRHDFMLPSPPRAFLGGDPAGLQQIILEAEKPFRVSSVDYLTGSGKPVSRQELQLQGKHIAHPVEDQFVRAVLRIESNPWDGSGAIQFRFHIWFGNLERDIVYVVAVVPEIKLGPAGRVREFRRLVDPRTVPPSMTSVLIN